MIRTLESRKFGIMTQQSPLQTLSQLKRKFKDFTVEYLEEAGNLTLQGTALFEGFTPQGVNGCGLTFWQATGHRCPLMAPLPLKVFNKDFKVSMILLITINKQINNL